MKTLFWRLLLIFSVLFFGCSGTEPDPSGPDVPDNPDNPDRPSGRVRNTVFVIFKTHLDVGFTALPSEVEKQYIEKDFPAALKVIEEMKIKGPDKYIWTVGSWVLDEYLKKASPDNVARMEKAIADGDIVWNAMPATLETETTTAEMLDAMLLLSARLDRKYGKKTISAKMSDVPGHTRSMIPSLARAGVKLLHISQNKSTTMPQLPSSDYPGICRWRHPDGSEVLLLDKKPYSHEIELPDGNILSINLKQDNLGPHTVDQVRNIYKDLRTRYPAKRVIASDLNKVADVLMEYKDEFPVFTKEIGDTWLHGFASAPARMAEVRALQRLYREWTKSGRLDPESDEAVDFCIRLGLVSEHTWGLDSKKYLQHEEPEYYNIESFTSYLNSGLFGKLEGSWKEIDDYVDQAIALLPAGLASEAKNAIAEAGTLPEYDPKGLSLPEGLADDGSFSWETAAGGVFNMGLFTLQTFGFTDFRAWIKTWMTSTSAKAGMEGSEAVSAQVHPIVNGAESETNAGRVVRCSMNMREGLNEKLYPAKVLSEYKADAGGRAVDMEFTLIDKPANRMAEAYWLSFVPSDIISVSVEKLGSMVNVEDVTEGGNGRMSGVDRYVEIVTSKGTYRIYSYDVPLVLAGGLDDIGYRSAPDLTKGVHFNLFNNLWGVNYSMWWKGSQRFRFRVELI